MAFTVSVSHKGVLFFCTKISVM